MEKQGVIFYFSGTGNTWWAAERLATELTSKGLDSKCISIEQLSTEQADELIAARDLIGFGYPIYGSDLPEVMKEFIAALAPAGGKDTFIFCTQWLFSGDGSRTGAELLQDKGFAVKWSEHFLMPNNISLTITPFVPYTNDKKKIEGWLARAGAKAGSFAGQISSGKPFLRGFSTAARLAGELQRAPFRRLYHKLRDDIGICQKRCTYCGLCARLCPSGNLAFAEKSLQTKGSCILCMRCYNFCPESAITYRKRPHNLKRGRPYQGPLPEFDPKILR